MRTEVAGTIYPTWIYQNFMNFIHTFHYNENFILTTFWAQATHKRTSCLKNVVLRRCGNIITITNLKNGRIGVAKCHKKDRFDLVIGIAIAWARYCAKDEQQLAEINKIISQLNSNKLGNVPVNTYFCCMNSNQMFLAVGTNPLDDDYIICISCYSAIPINLPKSLEVNIIQEKV